MGARPAGVEVDGATIRELRKLQGYTLKAFARRAGISLTYLSDIEIGRRPTVSPPVFVRIADALGVDRTQLIRTDAQEAA